MVHAERPRCAIPPGFTKYSPTVLVHATRVVVAGDHGKIASLRVAVTHRHSLTLNACGEMSAKAGTHSGATRRQARGTPICRRRGRSSARTRRDSGRFEGRAIRHRANHAFAFIIGTLPDAARR